MATPLPRSRGPLARFIVDHNPFYLLSALLMLLACLLLGNTMTWSPIGVDRIMMLIGVLNVYELLLVALGLYLIARRGLVRDGVMLLVFEAFFVVDVGFLNSEVYQQSQFLGEITNAVLLAFIAGKIWLIFRVLNLPVISARFVVTLVELATLLFMPGVLKRLSLDHNGALHAPMLYASWWLIAGLMAAAAIVTRFGPVDASNRPYARAARGIANTFLILPLVSLIAHMGTTHWVFAVPFHAIDLSPSLLGLAMLLTSIPIVVAAKRVEQRMVSGLLIVAAVLCAVNPGFRIDVIVGSLSISSTVITVVTAYLVTVYCFAIRYALVAITAGVVAGLAYLFGPTLATISETSSLVGNWAWDRLVSLVPKTQRQWGAVAMIGSFVLLIVGAWISLFRGTPPEASTDVPPTPPENPPAAAQPPMANLVQ